MHIGNRYGFFQTLSWSRGELFLPLLWGVVVTAAFEVVGFRWLAIPALPLSLVGVAVAFYLGFKNNSSYDRLWEARKIWGGIVNASRSWGFGARDLIGAHAEKALPEEDARAHAAELVRRHIAWMDALRFQLRKLKPWEHDDPHFMEMRKQFGISEYVDELADTLRPNLSPDELTYVLGKINPAAHLLANQSKRLAGLRRANALDGFSHMQLQSLLDELMIQQGKAERIKNFPLPRQYATVNHFFAVLFTVILPFGLLDAFHGGHPFAVWMVGPFTGIVSWVFLTMNKIGEWSENPFEGLHNDVPISQMSRGIERDILQMLDEAELPAERAPLNKILY